MIRYTLRCDAGHSFESWFQSSAAYDSLRAAGHVSCAICGSATIEKSLMAPAVAPSEGVAAARPDDDERVQRLRALKREIERNADNVGPRFASEARAMHVGDIPHRPIYGEAKPAEAKGLIDDGVPVVALPFVPGKPTN